MKVSIVTAVLNGGDMIEGCVRSVLQQTYPDRELIVIDGGSADSTIGVLERYADQLTSFVSEPDGGLYDAMNKGLARATGEVVGFLNADDRYASPRVLEEVVQTLEGSGADSCYGDLLYMHAADPRRILRSWVSSPYCPGLFQWGWMPPHPTFFVKRAIYERYGGFNPAFRIAADYELMLRFLERHGITTAYIPQVLVHMRNGGLSNRTLPNILRKTWEDYHAWRVNDLKARVSTIVLKNLSKIPQFWPFRGKAVLHDDLDDLDRRWSET